MDATLSIATSRFKEVSDLWNAQLSDLKKCPKSNVRLSGQRSGLRDFPSNDRVSMEFTFCKKKIHWVIMVNLEDPTMPPDFLLPKGEENVLSLEKLKSLASWSLGDSGSLSPIVQEALTLYKEEHAALARSYPSERIHFELSTIDGLAGVELLRTQHEHSTQIRLLIPLAIDTKALGSKEDVKAHLYVVFYPDDASRRPETTLLTPESWGELLNAVTLPTYHSDTCLVEYIPAVQDLVQESLVDFTLRRQLIEALIVTLGSALEYDSKSFKKVAFQIDDKVYPMLLFFVIPSNYPKDKPTITVQSVCMPRGRPFTSRVAQFPWSPRWGPDEFAKRFKGHLVESLFAEFKRAVQREEEDAESSYGY